VVGNISSNYCNIFQGGVVFFDDFRGFVELCPDSTQRTLH